MVIMDGQWCIMVYNNYNVFRIYTDSLWKGKIESQKAYEEQQINSTHGQKTSRALGVLYKTSQNT